MFKWNKTGVIKWSSNLLAQLFKISVPRLFFILKMTMWVKTFVPIFENYYSLDEYKLFIFNEEIQVSQSSYELIVENFSIKFNWNKSVVMKWRWLVSNKRRKFQKVNFWSKLYSSLFFKDKTKFHKHKNRNDNYISLLEEKKSSA